MALSGRVSSYLPYLNEVLSTRNDKIDKLVFETKETVDLHSIEKFAELTVTEHL